MNSVASDWDIGDTGLQLVARMRCLRTIYILFLCEYVYAI